MHNRLSVNQAQNIAVILSFLESCKGLNDLLYALNTRTLTLYEMYIIAECKQHQCIWHVLDIELVYYVK